MINLKDTHLKELLIGSSLSFTFKFLGILLWYVFIYIITTNLGAEGMGFFAIFFTVLQISAVVARLGLDRALVKLVAEFASKGMWTSVNAAYRKALLLALSSSLIAMFLLFVSAPYISRFIFNKEQLTSCLQLASMSILPFVFMTINLESLRGLKKIKEYSFFQDTAVFLLASVLLFFALPILKDKIVPIVTYIIALSIVSAVSYIYWIRNSRIKAGGGEEKISAAFLLNISLPMLMSSSLILIMGWTDTLILGIFRTEHEVGVYSVALRLAAITSGVLFAINSIAAPKFAEFHSRGDMVGLEKISQQSTRLIFWTSIPVLLIFFIFPSFVLGIFGGDFKKGAYALIFLSLGQFISAVSGSVGYILQMTGRHMLFQKIILLATGTNIILNFILIPIYGINGAAMASMFGIIVSNVMSVIAIKKEFGIRTFFVPKIWAREV